VLFSIAISSFLSALGLTVAAKVMNVGLTIVKAFIVCSLTGFISLGLPLDNPISYGVLFVLQTLCLKLVTGESIFSVIKLTIVAAILAYAFIQTVGLVGQRAFAG
jgi:hypothetical protein